MKRLLFLLAFFICVPASAPAASTPLAGVFEISHDGAGNLTQFDILGVVDARQNDPKPKPMAFPKAYLDSARNYVRTHLKRGAPGHYFTYFLFDPDNPTDLGISD